MALVTAALQRKQLGPKLRLPRLLFLDENHELANVFLNGSVDHMFLFEIFLGDVRLRREFWFPCRPARSMLGNDPIEFQRFCCCTDLQLSFTVKQQYLCINEQINPAFHIMVSTHGCLEHLAIRVEKVDGREAVRKHNKWRP